MEGIQLTVNGKSYTLREDKEMPLLFALRDILKLKGTKFGCGRGLCGACTIHMDGIAMRSCSLPIQAAAGRKITTIEGLNDELGRKLKDQWVEENVPQCGYCQPGQIMSAASLLGSKSKPDLEEIQQTMQGNLCRCGTYQRIQKAILAVAEDQS